MGFFQNIKAVLTRSQGADPNFSQALQFYTPGQPIWSDKNYATYVRQGYKKNPTVYACINKISGAASGIQWKLYTDRDRKKTIDNHPLLDLWRKPNPHLPGTGSFVEQFFGYWHMAGNSYVWAYRTNPQSPPLALWPLRPDRVKAVAGKQGIEDYVYGYGSADPQIFDLADIMHVKFPGYDDDVYGLSPIEVASYYSDQQNEAMGWNTSLMQNAGRPASVFFAKGILTPEQRNSIREEIRKKYSGKRNAGRPLILEADMTWQNMSLTPLELDFLRSYELGTRVICSIFDVAPELVGDSAGKTFANVKEARIALYVDNTLPKLDRLSDYLNSWLVPMYADLVANGAYFSYDRKDIEELQERYEAQKTAEHERARADWMAGGITLNEYREVIGQEDLKNGDCVRIGAVLVSIDSLEDYADQSLSEPAGPPMPVPEPLNVPSNPALPGPNPTQPALPAPKPAKGSKAKDASGVYQPDDVDERLAAYSAQGVTHLRWVVDGHPCPICLQNDGVMVNLGDPFPSGHLLPQAHPNCECEVITYSQPGFGFASNQQPRETKRSMGQETMQMLAIKIADLLKTTEGYNHVEENIQDAEITSDNGTLSLSFMPVQTKTTSKDGRGTPEDNSQSDANSQTPELVTTGDKYRAFIQRYT